MCIRDRSCLADGDVFVVRVTDLPDRCHALHQHLAGLARGQLQQCILAFFRHQVDLRASGTGHLRALARTELDVMHDRPQRDVLQRQGIADENVGVRAAHDRLSDLQPDRLNRCV